MSNSAQSPELQSKLAMWKLKAEEGTITLDEMKTAIILMRADRKAASEASSRAVASKSTKRPARSSDEMLAELDGL